MTGGPCPVNPQQRPGASAPRPIRRVWRWYSEPGSDRKVARDEMGSLREDGEAALAEVIKRFRVGEERPGEIEKLTDCQGLWAVRARVGRDQFRAVFFYDTDIICVCVTAVDKNQRKLPPVDRKRAIDRMKRWQQEGHRRATAG
jgi:hypothetical protein